MAAIKTFRVDLEYTSYDHKALAFLRSKRRARPAPTREGCGRKVRRWWPTEEADKGAKEAAGVAELAMRASLKDPCEDERAMGEVS